MFARLSVLLALTAAAVVVSANPIVIRNSPVTVPLARRFNDTGVHNIVAQDKARLQVLKTRSQGQKGKQVPLIDVPVTNQATIYTVSLGVGTPPTTYDLIVDTGSSNTWVGANKEKRYVVTNSSVDTGEDVSVTYGSGAFYGEQYNDTITLGDLVIPNQGISGAKFALGFGSGLDGILGIGPADLTVGSTSGGGAVPTVTDNAFAQGLIDSAAVGISFEPTTEASVTNGVLSFGGVDESKLTSEVAYVPITATEPASHYVGIDQSITYGAEGKEILATTAGITDTGTTLILIASDAFDAYQSATGAVPDSDTTGLLKLTPEQFEKLESLFFHIGDSTYELTPNAQIWPRSLNSAIGGDADSVYLIVADIGGKSGSGLDFVDGFTFLERFYQVYDSAKGQVGFATTKFTNATTN